MTKQIELHGKPGYSFVGRTRGSVLQVSVLQVSVLQRRPPWVH
jgi:hypothetical protein